MRKVSIALQLLAAVLSIGASVRYMTANEFMPYHAMVAGQAWETLSPGLRVIITGMLRILAGGFLGCGVALAFLATPLWRAERWAAWASLFVGLAVWAPTLAVTLMLKSAVPAAQPPTLPTAVILVVVIAAFITGLLSRPPKSNEA